MHTKEHESHKPPRNTLSNFVKLVSSGQFIEILKVLRRRLLNSLKIFRRLVGVVYDQPILVKRRQKNHLRHILAKYYSYSKKDYSLHKIRVALVLRDGAHYPKSSAFIRLIGPLTNEAVSDKVFVELFSENTTQLTRPFDVTIVQRTAFDDEKTARKFVENMKAVNTPVIIDSDDAFHSVDPFHPERAELQDKASALNYIFSKADEIWLSTNTLKSYLTGIKNKVLVMPNSLDERVWGKTHPSKTYTNSTPLQFVYMGTVSHDADLEMIFPSLDKIASDYPGSFELTVIGVSRFLPERPWIKRLYQKRGGSIYPKFTEWFLKQGPFDVGLSPLVDTPFNLSKSDIKCLDYLAAGIIPLVSDVKPYGSKELDSYILRTKNTDTNWKEAIEKLVKNPEKFREEKSKIVPKAQKYIWGKRSSEITAKKLLKELQRLTKN